MNDRINLLREAVCKHYNISVEDFDDRRRFREVVDAKRMFCFFARKHFKKTYKSIADLLNSHHATVIHHEKKMKDYLSFDKEEMVKYLKIRDMMFSEETYIDAQDEYDCLIREKILIEARMKEIELELKSLNKFKYGN